MLSVPSMSVTSSCQPSLPKAWSTRLRLWGAQPRSAWRCATTNQSLPWAAPPAGLELRQLLAEGASRERHRAARLVRVFACTALRVDGHCAAERVESERGIRARDQLDAGNRPARDEIPIDRIAERFIDSHAVVRVAASCRSHCSAATRAPRRGCRPEPPNPDSESELAREAAPDDARLVERETGMLSAVSGSDAGYRIATPQGSLPTAMSLSLTARSVSITETVPERPQAT